MSQLQLLARLTEILIKQRFEWPEIDRFVAYWVGIDTDTPIGCPKCFFAGSVSPLVALHPVDEIEPVKCRSCGEIFNLRPM